MFVRRIEMPAQSPASGFGSAASPAPASRSAPIDATPAILGLPEAGGAVRCVACAHRCVIRPGRAGICRVRENRDGELVTLVFGRAVAANADPIEKKPLFHFFPGSVAYSIATQGCNFHCDNCQNWSISQAVREGGSISTQFTSPASVVQAARNAGARSIAYTYSEPTVFIEYVLETARLAAEAGLANVMVTNGYQTPEALDLLAPHIAAANVDLKSFDDRFYRRVAGARLMPVLESLVGMRRRGIWVEVTTLLIPGLNDQTSNLELVARWIATELGPETPWHVSRFFPNYKLMSLDPTPISAVARAVSIGRDAGLRHVYTGNVRDGDDDTHCADCGERLIQRSGYSVLRTDAMIEGACGSCGKPLAGVGLAAGLVAALPAAGVSRH
jgi:pyruvate formate lyase activating enzyme